MTGETMSTASALSVDNIDVYFDHFHALKSVSIDVARGESYGLVGNPVPASRPCCVPLQDWHPLKTAKSA